MTISPPSGVGAGPAALTDEELQNFVASPLVGCAGTTLDPSKRVVRRLLFEQSND